MASVWADGWACVCWGWRSAGCGGDKPVVAGPCGGLRTACREADAAGGPGSGVRNGLLVAAAAVPALPDAPKGRIPGRLISGRNDMGVAPLPARRHGCDAHVADRNTSTQSGGRSGAGPAARAIGRPDSQSPRLTRSYEVSVVTSVTEVTGEAAARGAVHSGAGAIPSGRALDRAVARDRVARDRVARPCNRVAERHRNSLPAADFKRGSLTDRAASRTRFSGGA
jgi:hypothetical protein